MNTLQRILKRLFSSLMFGGLFGCTIFTSVLYVFWFGWRASVIVLLCWAGLVASILVFDWFFWDAPSD